MIIRTDSRGELNVLLIPLILLTLLFVSVGAFAVWAYGQRQDFKNNVDAKIAAAIDANTANIKIADSKQFAEAAKQPLKTYKGPDAYGGVNIQYPKTWSAYIDVSNKATPLNAFYYPDFVPSISDPSSSFALRVQVVPTAYDQVVSQFKGALQQQKVTISPFALAKVPDTVGVRVDGQITTLKQGSMVILPVRDKTLKIWTEASPFTADFNNNILPNFSFSP